MFEKRSVSDMGATIFEGANSVHHFCYGRYQSPSRLNWGNLRVLRVRLEPRASRSPNSLSGMDVIILSEKGEIEIQCGDRKVRLSRGGCAVLAMGIGADYGIANVTDTDSTYVEIWFSLSETPEFSSYGEVDARRRTATIRTSRSRSDLTALTERCRARTSILSLRDGKRLDWKLDCADAYLMVLTGRALIGGVWCETGDAIALHEESRLAIMSKGPCEILAIQMPGKSKSENDEHYDFQARSEALVTSSSATPSDALSMLGLRPVVAAATRVSVLVSA